MSEDTQEQIDERKKRAIEFLTRNRVEDKRPDQFTAKECAELMNRKDESFIYAYMDELVEKGLWESGRAIDPISHKFVKVWWIKAK